MSREFGKKTFPQSFSSHYSASNICKSPEELPEQFNKCPHKLSERQTTLTTYDGDSKCVGHKKAIFIISIIFTNCQNAPCHLIANFLLHYSAETHHCNRENFRLKSTNLIVHWSIKFFESVLTANGTRQYNFSAISGEEETMKIIKATRGKTSVKFTWLIVSGVEMLHEQRDTSTFHIGSFKNPLGDICRFYVSSSHFLFFSRFFFLLRSRVCEDSETRTKPGSENKKSSG